MKPHITSAISQAFGRFASKEFPSIIQHIINASYVKIMGLDMERFLPPSHYKSLNALFTRALQKQPLFDNDANEIISPVDALVTEWGKVSDTKAYQIKGFEYQLAPLLGEENSEYLPLLEGGSYCNLYLSPRDYHRYHMPTSLKVESMLHIPGKLYPVNMRYLNSKQNLFLENERVVLRCKDTNQNLFFIVLVGALNVGKMRVAFEPELQTNADATKPTYWEYDNKQLTKGELLGWFEMGSTVLLFTQSASFDLRINQKLTFGQPIGQLEN